MELLKKMLTIAFTSAIAITVMSDVSAMKRKGDNIEKDEAKKLKLTTEKHISISARRTPESRDRLAKEAESAENEVIEVNQKVIKTTLRDTLAKANAARKAQNAAAREKAAKEVEEALLAKASLDGIEEEEKAKRAADMEVEEQGRLAVCIQKAAQIDQEKRKIVGGFEEVAKKYKEFVDAKIDQSNAGEDVCLILLNDCTMPFGEQPPVAIKLEPVDDQSNAEFAQFYQEFRSPIDVETYVTIDELKRLAEARLAEIQLMEDIAKISFINPKSFESATEGEFVDGLRRAENARVETEINNLCEQLSKSLNLTHKAIKQKAIKQNPGLFEKVKDAVINNPGKAVGMAVGTVLGLTVGQPVTIPLVLVASYFGQDSLAGCCIPGQENINPESGGDVAVDLESINPGPIAPVNVDQANFFNFAEYFDASNSCINQ